MTQQEVSLQIEGMTCAACANRIEKGLNKIDGVVKANVNFAIEKTKVIYDSEKTDVHDFEEKIAKLGYRVVYDKQTFDVSGMTCAACATKVEKQLSKMGGVSGASVNFALENVTVE